MRIIKVCIYISLRLIKNYKSMLLYVRLLHNMICWCYLFCPLQHRHEPSKIKKMAVLWIDSEWDQSPFVRLDKRGPIQSEDGWLSDASGHRSRERLLATVNDSHNAAENGWFRAIASRHEIRASPTDYLYSLPIPKISHFSNG